MKQDVPRNYAILHGLPCLQVLCAKAPHISCFSGSYLTLIPALWGWLPEDYSKNVITFINVTYVYTIHFFFLINTRFCDLIIKDQ